MEGVGPQAVFVDANVWFSRTLRDWIGLLYVTPDTAPFSVYWTEDVLAELLANLREKYPDWPGSKTTKLRDLLAQTFELGRVDDFVVDGSYHGPDPKDAHVHAAALACRADVLLTANARDFVWDHNTSPYEVMRPDDFLVLVDDSAPQLVETVVSRMCSYWVSRDGEADLPTSLRKADCPDFAERVRLHLRRRM